MRPFPHPSERGFSMVELMVAMLIGLIGMIIIFQVFEVSEGIKRSTTSGGDAQQNGAVALYVVEHDLRNAGMGFNDVAYAGCNILAFDSQRATSNFAISLVPALITPGATAVVPDTLTVFYGSKPRVANATMLAGNWNAAADPLQLMNSYGYRPGDLVVLLEPASGKNCSLMEVTGPLPMSNSINHADSGTSYTLLSGANQLARFNQAGGLGVLYGGLGTANVARVFNLGNLYEPAGTPNIPVYNTYAIDARNSLTVSSAFVIDPATRAPQVSAVADNIVHLRAQYGLDDGGSPPGTGDGSVTFGGIFAAGDGLVDRFVSAAVFNAIVPAPWQSLIAVRLAIVARSALAEKPLGSDGAKCDATTDGTETTPGPDRRPRWSGGVIDVSASGDPAATSLLYWKCYRYRVFETTIPLRNWIWKSS